MTLIGPVLAELEHADRTTSAALPAAAHHFAPATIDEAKAVFSAASEERAPVLIHGAGTRQGIGHPVFPEVVVSTARLNRVVAWEPEDLTMVVEPGALVADVERALAERNQTAALPEWEGSGTVGGAIAAGISGYRRSRYGPTRERMLEATIVTGDGRVVRGGGRVVKNVSGYDIPRLATGSFGALGLIVSVCLKLLPLPRASVTVSIESPAQAWSALYRPLAVLETSEGSYVYLQGSEPEVEWQAAQLVGRAVEGLSWPAPPSGRFEASLRVPPAEVTAMVQELGAGWSFVAQHGVGMIEVAADAPDVGDILRLRGWAESRGGALVVTRGADLGVDPWGTPPSALDLQRRVVAGFDPVRIANPGRLPGGI